MALLGAHVSEYVFLLCDSCVIEISVPNANSVDLVQTLRSAFSYLTRKNLQLLVI